MAYTKLRDILDVALELQASSLGLTIDQLMDRTGRSRKTVERMLQGLSEIGLEMEPSHLESDHHLTKRWRLRADMPGTLLALQSHERGALERHLQNAALMARPCPAGSVPKRHSPGSSREPCGQWIALARPFAPSPPGRAASA